MPRVCILGIDIIDCIERITTPHKVASLDMLLIEKLEMTKLLQ